MTKRDLVLALNRYSGAEHIYIIDGAELFPVGAVVRVEGKIALDVSAGEEPLDSKTLRAFPALVKVCSMMLRELRTWQPELEFDDTDTMVKPLFDELKAALEAAGVDVKWT